VTRRPTRVPVPLLRCDPFRSSASERCNRHPRGHPDRSHGRQTCGAAVRPGPQCEIGDGRSFTGSRPRALAGDEAIDGRIVGGPVLRICRWRSRMLTAHDAARRSSGFTAGPARTAHFSIQSRGSHDCPRPPTSSPTESVGWAPWLAASAQAFPPVQSATLHAELATVCRLRYHLPVPPA
jgi:hypothetical protein